MASAPEMGRGRPSSANIACALRGWNSPRPISIRLPSDCLGTLRESVRRDLAALIPRCEALERSLPDRMLRHRGYAASKLHRDFPLDVSLDGAAGGCTIATLTDPTPRTRLAPVAEAGGALPESLFGTGPILAVGGAANPGLHELLMEQNTVHVTPGDGGASATGCGGRRPAAESF